MIEPEEPRHFKLKQLDASTLCRIAGRDVSKTDLDHVPNEYPTGKALRHDESEFFSLVREG